MSRLSFFRRGRTCDSFKGGGNSPVVSDRLTMLVIIGDENSDDNYNGNDNSEDNDNDNDNDDNNDNGYANDNDDNNDRG